MSEGLFVAQRTPQPQDGASRVRRNGFEHVRQHNTGATVIVTSDKYPGMHLTVHPGERVAIDATMEIEVPTELTAVTS